MQTSHNAAVIDIGTHSVLLLIARKNRSGQIEIVHQSFAVGRLGSELGSTGNIPEEAVKRVLGINRDFMDTSRRLKVNFVYLMGTEVFRKAVNGGEVAEFFRQELQCPLKILSAEEEAIFAFQGAATVLPSGDHPLLLADVGGGSTEFVLGRGNQVYQWYSLPLGAFVLAQREGITQILSPGLQVKLNLEVRQYLAKIPIAARLSRDTELIASGGTASTLAALSLKMAEYDSRKINGLRLHKDRIKRLFDKINALSAEDRRKMPGMEKGREDVVLYGILIYLNIMDRFGFSALRVTDRGARFGYIAHVLNRRS